MIERIPQRTAVALAAAVLASGAGVGLAGCSGEQAADDRPTTTATMPGPTLPFDDSPTRAEIEAGTGLVFPPGTGEFRSVATFPSKQLDVSFTVPAAEVPAFVSASKLETPEEDRKVLPHGSPLWDRQVPPEIPLSGSVTLRDSLAISTEFLEVSPDATQVRLSIAVTGPASEMNG